MMHVAMATLRLLHIQGLIMKSGSLSLPCRTQHIRFARASSYDMYVADFNTHNKLLNQKLLKQYYQYHKLRKTFF